MSKIIDTITASSNPIWGFFAPFRWDSADLMRWYELLLQAHGRTGANEKFLEAWNSAPFYDTLRLASSADQAFMNLAKNNNLFTSSDEVANTVEKIPGNVLSILNTALSPTFFLSFSHW